MRERSTRRQFLERLGVIAVGAALPARRLLAASAEAPPPLPRVVIARDERLQVGRIAGHRELVRKMLDATLQRLTDAESAGTAWRQLIDPSLRVGIKVNTLGLTTQPTVVDAIVDGLQHAGMPDRNILIWDRFDVELDRAGFALNTSQRGVRCRGTDAERAGRGYLSQIEVSGEIGSCYSRIAAEEVDVLISVPVLKDHNLAGVSLGMKNFYGAIHNPNKYHDRNCDPYIVDVVSHPFIARKWKLTVCDATRAQYHAGPGANPAYAWSFGGLIVSADVVAADAVAADLLETRRREAGLEPLADAGRPTRHIATAAARGLGAADLTRIERIEL